MYDDLRQQLEPSAFIEDEELQEPEELNLDTLRRKRPFLGLTPVQRFVLALMLFLNVCLLGFFCLMATGRIVLPF